MITDEALMAYLDGEADPERVRAIEAAIARNPGLRTRLAEMESRDRAVKTAFDALLDRPAPPKLVNAARLAPETALGAVIPFVARAKATPRRGLWIGVGIAAQAAVLAAAFVLIHAPGPARPESAQYVALGAAPKAHPANAMVVFKPETPERDLRAALSEANARVVGGPTPAGAWLIETPAPSRDAAVAKLRARGDVSLAQPVDAP